MVKSSIEDGQKQMAKAEEEKQKALLSLQSIEPSLSAAKSNPARINKSSPGSPLMSIFPHKIQPLELRLPNKAANVNHSNQISIPNHSNGTNQTLANLSYSSSMSPSCQAPPVINRPSNLFPPLACTSQSSGFIHPNAQFPYSHHPMLPMASVPEFSSHVGLINRIGQPTVSEPGQVILGQVGMASSSAWPSQPYLNFAPMSYRPTSSSHFASMSEANQFDHPIYIPPIAPPRLQNPSFYSNIHQQQQQQQQQHMQHLQPQFPSLANISGRQISPSNTNSQTHVRPTADAARSIN